MEMKVKVCDACRSEMDDQSREAWGSLSVSARTESGGGGKGSDPPLLSRRVEAVTPREVKKNRMIRVPDSLWDRAKQRADERGETVSEAVRRFLERYVR